MSWTELLLLATIPIFIGIPVVVWFAAPKKDRMGWGAWIWVRHQVTGQ
jgi:hypothetical protein